MSFFSQIGLGRYFIEQRHYDESSDSRVVESYDLFYRRVLCYFKYCKDEIVFCMIILKKSLPYKIFMFHLNPQRSKIYY